MKDTTPLVDCDVSGTRKVTIKPTMINSALGVRDLKHKRDGNTIRLTLVTSVIGKGITTSPKPISRGQALEFKIEQRRGRHRTDTSLPLE